MVNLMRRRELMQLAGEPPAPWYITDSLTNHWDAINNTGSGHDGTVSTWTDLVGTISLVAHNSNLISWNDDALVLPGTAGQQLQGNANTTTPSGRTIEVVFSVTESQAAVIVTPFYNSYNTTSKNDSYGKICLFSDDTFNCKGKSETSYTIPASIGGLSHLHSISASFSSNTAVNGCYANAISASKGSVTHSLKVSQTRMSVGACPDTNGSPTSTDWNYPFKGKIHSIRLYHKQLSAAEVAHNYAIDVARFNLEV